jgi:hypothetical protein
MAITVALVALCAAAFVPHPSVPLVVRKSRCASTTMCADDYWAGYQAELRARIRDAAAGANLGPPGQVLGPLEAAWVLIFNPGKKDEGVYTLQGRTQPTSSYVLAFEQTDEATRFAQLLQAEGFDLPQPMQWRAEQLRSFCESGEFELGIVPTGTLLTPPTHNEYDTDAYSQLDSPHDFEAERKRLDRLFRDE